MPKSRVHSHGESKDGAKPAPASERVEEAPERRISEPAPPAGPAQGRRKSTDVRHPLTDVRQELLARLEAAGLTAEQLARARGLELEDLEALADELVVAP
jgi:hypothetical protein